jgi:hypothetical protein
VLFRNKLSPFVMPQSVFFYSCRHVKQLLILHKPMQKRSQGKTRIYKKYPFKQMRPGETFKLNDVDVRDAQKAAYYYRSLCKRPIKVVITKQDDGYYCRRVAK